MWHRIDDPDNPPPKDGTGCLVAEKYGDNWFIAHAKWDEDDETFIDAQGEQWETYRPTHWQPLPPPPAEDTP